MLLGIVLTDGRLSARFKWDLTDNFSLKANSLVRSCELFLHFPWKMCTLFDGRLTSYMFYFTWQMNLICHMAWSFFTMRYYLLLFHFLFSFFVFLVFEYCDVLIVSMRTLNFLSVFNGLACLSHFEQGTDYRAQFQLQSGALFGANYLLVYTLATAVSSQGYQTWVAVNWLRTCWVDS